MEKFQITLKGLCLTPIVVQGLLNMGGDMGKAWNCSLS